VQWREQRAAVATWCGLQRWITHQAEIKQTDIAANNTAAGSLIGKNRPSGIVKLGRYKVKKSMEYGQSE
jgi:hypothetical protein